MKKYIYIPKSTKKKGPQPNPDVASIQEDDWESIKQAIRYNDYGGVGNIKKDIWLLRNVKQIRKKDRTDKTEADFIYNYYRPALMTGPEGDYSNELFVVYSQRLLNWADIPNPLRTTTNKNKEPPNKLASYRNTTWFIALPESDKYYLLPMNYLIPHEVLTCYQGRQAILEPDRSKVKAGRKRSSFPMSMAEGNRNVTTIRADVNNTLLTVHRSGYRTGTQKECMQTALAKMEDVGAAYRRLLSIGKEFVEEIGRKYADDLQEIFRKGCEQEKDDYRWEINLYHSEDAQELLNYQMRRLGSRLDNAVLIYDVRYAMDDHVRKAEPHYMFSVGKLLGGQTLVEGGEYKRSVDIYMSAPRIFQWNTTVNLPAGYEAAAEGVEKLSVKVENGRGAFVVKAVAQNGKFILDTAKRYNHKTEPATNWDRLPEIQDASKACESLSIVLKK